jgi:hypothetical protein
MSPLLVNWRSYAQPVPALSEAVCLGRRLPLSRQLDAPPVYQSEVGLGIRGAPPSLKCHHASTGLRLRDCFSLEVDRPSYNASAQLCLNHSDQTADDR